MKIQNCETCGKCKMNFVNEIKTSRLTLYGQPINQMDYDEILFFMNNCLFELATDPDFHEPFPLYDLDYVMIKNGIEYVSESDLYCFLDDWVMASNLVAVTCDHDCYLTDELAESLKVDLF